ncbi:MAG: hypothetical protein IJW37_08410 [Lachnospiraceae bacterium]|nr:hypothetical protein [Lachnospiraceae bacterium]
MIRQGSVTVTFSLVFMVLLSFILSFFEMAAYTARASYHTSASLLAVENYFAEYLEPLYSNYHIFGREVKAGEGIVPSTQKAIGADIAYMTVKEEGQKSLLLRSGAKFSVVSADALTSNQGEGFYTQATTAMKYRGVVEIKELIEQFTGVTKQTDTHLGIAAAKAATDEAYAVVEGKLLTLMEQVDGVVLSEYEQYLRGASTVFQANAYVKQLCADKERAAEYFDRAEVYRSFLETSKNHEAILADIIWKTEYLLPLVRAREEAESKCRTELSEVTKALESIAESLSAISAQQQERFLAGGSLQQQIEKLSGAETPDTERIESLTQQVESLLETMAAWDKEKQALLQQQEVLTEEKKELENRLYELELERGAQEEKLWELAEEERSLVDRCGRVAGKCTEAKQTLREIHSAMELAKKAKANCEKVIDAAALLLGESEVKSYREALNAYQLYESAEGYDFNLMQETLTSNEGILNTARICFNGTSSAALESALVQLKAEQESLRGYSFEGLMLNYGELSLEENPYEGMEEALITKVSEGFLGFLTTEELSDKILETTYLPSGFRYEGEEEKSVFSVLGLGVEDVFEEIRSMLPQDLSLASMAEQVTDSVLFHSYLTTHFSDVLEPNKNGALSYETEYLIEGKTADINNLSGVAMRICLIRTALQFVSLYGDSARRMQAEQAATAACGVIGLPAMIGVVTFALLLVWAVEEAMIDTAALLQGKRLALYPGATGGSLAFSELLLFSETMVSERAKTKKDVSGMVFGYGEYLQLFLLLEGKEEKCYRAMDLVQENLRLSYHTSFRLKRCIWRISYKVDNRKYYYAYDW